MTELSDESLMLFADGLLDARESEHMRHRIDGDAGLSARLAAFQATGRNLAGLFEASLAAPLPDRLREILSPPAASPAGIGGQAGSFRLRAAARRLPGRGIFRLPAGIAASLALLAGLGLGWLLHHEAPHPAASPGDFVRLDKDRLFAEEPLQSTLEREASGVEAAVAFSRRETSAKVLVRMTFRNSAGEYCRVYQIAAAEAERYEGVACRTEGRWQVRIQALMPPPRASAERIVPASGSARPMDAVVSTMIEGDPILGEEEAIILGKGWQE